MTAILRLDDVHTDIAQYHVLHGITLDAVSYTHLTLPTSDLV